MELVLVESNECRKTRIKVSKKELERDAWLKSILANVKVERESSRFLYFLVDGDLLNKKVR